MLGFVLTFRLAQGRIERAPRSECGRRQVVRHQPSKLTFTGSNPVARSDFSKLWSVVIWATVLAE